MVEEKILVVEDDLKLGELFCKVLTEEGYSVEVAVDGKRALDMIQAGDFNVALVDLKLPDMTGIDVLKFIKQENKDTQFILMTGYPTIETSLEAMKLGAYDYIQKPINLTELNLLITNCIEKGKLIKENTEAKKIKAIYEISKGMSSTINLDQLLNLILNLACDNVGGDSSSIMLLNEETQELELKTCIGLSKGVKTTRIKMGERIAGWIAQHKEPMILVNGLEKYPQFMHLDSRPEIKTALCIPLKIKDKVVGVLNINSINSENMFNESDKELLTVFAQNAAIVIENAKLYEQTKKAKNYIENIIRNISDVLIVTDSEGSIKTVNQAALDLLGYEEHELIGKPSGILFEEENIFEQEEFKQLLKEGSVRNYNMVYKTKTGEKIPVSFSSSMMKDAGNEKNNSKMAGFVGIARDMREMISIQAQLIQSAKMAAIGEIGAGVVHELNSPLAGICMLTNVLRKKIDKQIPQYHFLEEIKNAAEHCSNIVHDLLNFSRRDKGEFKPVNCNEAINGVLTFIGHQIELVKIKIIKDFQPDVALVSGNSGQLQQVFLNMMNNAKDAMPEGGTLTITTRTVEAERKSVEIEFTDTGTGMNEQVMGKVFDSFFSTKKAGKGLGLGLAITSQIIQRHNGSINIKSELGKGTTFTITLPCAHTTQPA